jgi:oxygen-independent coproporphyrinogen-3 oxidase
MAGLYIHIPFCKSKCAYCDFPSFAGREGEAGRYIHAMRNEAEIWREKILSGSSPGRGGVPYPPAAQPYPPAAQPYPPAAQPNPSAQPQNDFVFHTVFIGGGTPSLLSAGDLEQFMGSLRAFLTIDAIEFTVEANPGTVDKAKLESFRRMGAGRISFGAQAAQDRLLKRIGRIHTWADFVRSFELALEAGFTNISADMMTGLPGQTISDAAETAEKLAALGPEHVSCYGLILEEGTPLLKAVEEGREALPDNDTERDMFHAARAALEGAGLRRYEISNFAVPGRECLHNLNYWHNGDWLGLGLGAASHFHGYRKENRRDMEAYMQACEAGRLPPADEHAIGPEEAAFETIMLETRLAEGIDFGRFRERHGFDFLLKYREQVDGLISGGLMASTEKGVALTDRGMDLQNAVLMEFME